MTIHPTNHIDYSKGERVDHLFVVGEAGPTPAETGLLLTVSDTGLDLVLDSQTAGWRDRNVYPRTKGFSLTWAEVIDRVLSGEFDHTTWSTDRDVPPGETTESDSTADEHVSCCGYCGEGIDYCQGHGEDEREEFGFDYDSDEYEARREAFEAAADEAAANDPSDPRLDPRLCDCGKGLWCPLWASWTGYGRSQRDEAVAIHEHLYGDKTWEEVHGNVSDFDILWTSEEDQTNG